MNRRDLFKSAALATGALAQQARAAAATDRIGIGVIGCGGMGCMDLVDFQKQPEAEIVAVCDVYQPNLREAHQLTDGKPRAYSDFRKLLATSSPMASRAPTPISANCWTTVRWTRWSSPHRIIGIRSSPWPRAMPARTSTWKRPSPTWCAKAA